MDPVKGEITNPLTMVQYTYGINNPLQWIDPLGLFLVGTVLTQQAYGDDVKKLNDYLYNNGYMSFWDHMYSGSIFTVGTTQAVKNFQSANGFATTGQVNQALWTRMGFSVNQTIEQEFWSGKKGSNGLNIVIQGNTITINYSPTIRIVEDRKRESYFLDLNCFQDVDIDTYKEYESRIIEGFKMWETEEASIQGVKVNVVVNVTPTRSESARANILYKIDDKGRGITMGALGWRPGKVLGFQVPLGSSTFEGLHNGVDNVSLITAHEFGHVLGIMDAYPEAYNYWGDVPYSRAGYYNLMRCVYSAAPTFENLHEMMLYAWLFNGMQGFFESELLATESQAFFH